MFKILLQIGVGAAAAAIPMAVGYQLHDALNAKPRQFTTTFFTRTTDNGCDYLTAYTDAGVVTVLPALDQPVTCKYNVLQPKTKR